MRAGSRRKWYVAPALLAIGCLSGISLVVQAERAPAAALERGSTAPTTPVLSARRVPDLIAAPVADRRLTAHLDELLSRTPREACLTVAVNGHVVYQHNPDMPLVPASIEKLMTAQAVLAVLGPQSVLTTTVKAAAPPSNGTLDGDLFMVGGGDPLLMTDAYAARFKHQPVVHSNLGVLADRIVAAGVTHITGAVVGDDSRYDAQRYVPQWPARFQVSAEVGPLGALTVNDALVEFPPNPDVKVPKEKGADDPAVHAADQLAQLLAARGVVIDRPPARGVAPADATEIASLESQPVGQIVAAMLTESDNGSAELLTKELAVHSGAPGTTSAGAAVVAQQLQAMNVPTANTTQFDGSGLASENKETCAAVQALLDQDGPGSDLAAGLPIAGQTGTLDERFVATPVAGRLRAKTGTLNQATALAGFVQSAQGAQLSFAFLINVPEPQKITVDDVSREEELGAILVQYPESVDVAALGPKP